MIVLAAGIFAVSRLNGISPVGPNSGSISGSGDISSAENSTSSDSDSQSSESKTRYVYGEVEIPDLPDLSEGEEGRASTLEGYLDQDRYIEKSKEFERCLDSMVFETHKLGDYTVSLVGDKVRTDSENFPGYIFVQHFRAEVEKNGEHIGDIYDGGWLSYVAQFGEELRLHADKIGDYIDLYDLEIPVIALRYWFDDDPRRLVTKCVLFTAVTEPHNGRSLAVEKGIGVMLNSDPESKYPYSALAPSEVDGQAAWWSLFGSDEFMVVDKNTLLDVEAGIEFTFDFTIDTNIIHPKEYSFSAKWIRLSSGNDLEISNSEYLYRRAHCFDKVIKQRGIYGETEIPDIHYENAESYFSQSGVVTHSPHGNEWEYIGLESMEFERHTVGEYTIRLVGHYVRTDKEFFPDRIFVSSLHVEVEKDGVKLSEDGSYYLPPMDLGSQYSPEDMILIDKIGSYLDLYELEYPVIAMRYYYPDEMEMDLGKIGRSVDFAVVMNGKCLSGFVGVFEPGCGLFFDNDSRKYKTNDMFTAYRGAMFKAEKFKISGENTLYDEDAGITYTFKFYDPPKPALYRAEKNVGSAAAASAEDWVGSPYT